MYMNKKRNTLKIIYKRTFICKSTHLGKVIKHKKSTIIWNNFTFLYLLGFF